MYVNDIIDDLTYYVSRIVSSCEQLDITLNTQGWQRRDRVTTLEFNFSRDVSRFVSNLTFSIKRARIFVSCFVLARLDHFFAAMQADLSFFQG